MKYSNMTWQHPRSNFTTGLSPATQLSFSHWPPTENTVLHLCNTSSLYIRKEMLNNNRSHTTITLFFFFGKSLQTGWLNFSTCKPQSSPALICAIIKMLTLCKPLLRHALTKCGEELGHVAYSYHTISWPRPSEGRGGCLPQGASEPSVYTSRLCH